MLSKCISRFCHHKYTILLIVFVLGMIWVQIFLTNHNFQWYISAMVAFVIGMSLIVSLFRTKINFLDAMVFASFGAVILSILEVGIGEFILVVFDYRMWEYRIAPTHDGFSHAMCWFTWWLYSIYWYYMWVYLDQKYQHGRWARILITWIDWPLAEVLINLVSLGIFSTYYFYYFPNDLRHVTTFYIIPFYFLAALMINSLRYSLLANIQKLSRAYKIELILVLLLCGMIFASA